MFTGSIRERITGSDALPRGSLAVRSSCGIDSRTVAIVRCLIRYWVVKRDAEDLMNVRRNIAFSRCFACNPVSYDITLLPMDAVKIDIVMNGALK